MNFTPTYSHFVNISIVIIVVYLMYIFIHFLQMKMYNDNDLYEGFETDRTNTKKNYRCPNLLIQKGCKYYLYNSKLGKVPGVNPIEFNNLEEYVEFLDWQKGAGIRCPVLYLQLIYDSQGNPIYKVRPSIYDLQGGLPPTTNVPLPLKFNQNTLLVDATKNDPPYNRNSYPAFDQTSYYVGLLTPLDTMDAIKNSEYLGLYSDNAMDPNWGGAAYTQALVDNGYYKDNEVFIKIP